MTRNELLNQFLILGAALLKESSNGNEHFEMQQNFIKDEILLNPAFGTPIDKLYKNNYIFNGEQGPIPTVKGWKSLQPRVVEVSKPFNRTKILQESLVPMTVNLMQEVCYRHKNHPKFAPYIRKQIMELGEAYNCVNEVISDVVVSVNQQEVETPVEEIKAVKRAKKALKEVEQVG